MLLSTQEKKEYSRYIVNSLVQKFKLSQNDAMTIVNKSSIIDDISKDFDKVIRFNSDELAKELIIKYEEHSNLK